MTDILKKIALATVIAVAVFLGCILVGGLFITVNVPIAVTIGGFLKTYATALAILAGIWYFFTH